MVGDGQPRLRTACDPCSAAKVGCDKNHPACKRCLQGNVPCSYSESRKHGKQSLRRKLAQNRAKWITSTVNANLMATPQDDGEEQLPQLAATAALSAVAAPSAGPPSDDLGGGGDSGCDPLLISPVSLLSPSVLLLQAQEQPRSLWSVGDSVNTNIDVDSLMNWDVADLLASDSPLPLSTGVGGQQENLFIPELNDGIGISSGVAEEDAACTTATSSSSSTKTTHDCEEQAISILRSLQHREVVPGATSCSTDMVHYTEFNLAPRFDHVLSTNRAALDVWIKLMQCSCVQCPHLTLLYVSVLNKMLFWYRVAADEQKTDDHREGGSNSGSDVTPSLSSPPAVDRFAVQTTVVKVGLFGLDADEQANMRRFLLMRELRRMEMAINELSKVDRTDMESGADAEAWRSVQWSLQGISRVREELQVVIGNLSKGLSLLQ